MQLVGLMGELNRYAGELFLMSAGLHAKYFK